MIANVSPAERGAAAIAPLRGGIACIDGARGGASDPITQLERSDAMPSVTCASRSTNCASIANRLAPLFDR
jgi:hypothetical protein